MISALHQEGKRSLGRHRPRRNYKIFSRGKPGRKKPNGIIKRLSERAKLKLFLNKYDTRLDPLTRTGSSG